MPPAVSPPAFRACGLLAPALLFLLTGCGADDPAARAVRIETLDQAVGGPKAMARPGDILLENGHLRFAILDARYSMGPSTFGGTIADADLVRSDPKWGGGHGNDQLAEMFTTVDLNLAAADEAAEVSILADGSDGGPAIVRVDAADEPFLTVLGLLWSFPDVSHPSMRLTTDYILEPDAQVLKIRTTATVVASDADVVPGSELPEAETLAGTDADLDVIGLAMETGAALGDFYLQGGSIDVFAPGIGFDEEKAVYEAAEAGRNLFREPLAFPFLGGTGTGVSYGMAAATGNLHVPLFTSSQTAAFGAGIEGDGTRARFPVGTAFAYERYLTVGKGDMGSVYDRLAAARGESVGTVRGNVLEEGSGQPLSGVSVFAYEAGAELPWNQWLSDVGEDTQLDGSFGGSLPPGDWELAAYVRGRPLGARVPVTVAAGETVEVALSVAQAGQVNVRIVDELGRLIPGKVTFFGAQALDPTLGDPFLGRADGEGPTATEVKFLPYGEGTLTLPPGAYSAVATRGFEYEIDRHDFEIGAQNALDLQFQLIHTVDTSGWVSADFHVHSVPSFDSGVTLPDRVATMVSEGVDYFTSTDHDAITDFAPVVEEMGLEPWIQTGIGLETTTLEVGHYIGFPLAHDFVAEQGGAFDWTGMKPSEILETIGELGIEAGTEPVRMVAHPRDGILGYFDQYGWNPYTGDTETPVLSSVNPLLEASRLTFEFDAIELLNGKRFEMVRTPTQPELDGFAQDPTSVRTYELVERTMEEQQGLVDGAFQLGYGYEGQIDDWFSLLNLGIRIPAVGNSDTHGKHSIEAGCPRNYVASDVDDPALLDDQAVADAVKAGHVIASYGPFVRFWIDDPANFVGTELATSEGEVDLHVEVEAPTWMAVDRVEIYQNGTLVHVVEDLDEGVVRLVRDIPLTVDRDSWFVVIAMGDSDLSPLFTAVEIPPVQLQDVVIEALSDVPSVGAFLDPAIPIPRSGAVFPFALTNPIYVDVGGDGWTAPGLPSWLVEPVDPNAD